MTTQAAAFAFLALFALWCAIYGGVWALIW